MDNKSHDIITEAMDRAGLVPVKFDKPLKSVYALVKLTKYITPNNLAERSQAVGWGMGNLLDSFGKELFNIRSLSVINNESGIFIEAILNISGLTFEDDYSGWLDSKVKSMTGEDYPSKGYCWTRLYWKWDKAERISDVMGFEQIDGSGTQGKSL